MPNHRDNHSDFRRRQRSRRHESLIISAKACLRNPSEIVGMLRPADHGSTRMSPERIGEFREVVVPGIASCGNWKAPPPWSNR